MSLQPGIDVPAIDESETEMVVLDGHGELHSITGLESSAFVQTQTPPAQIWLLHVNFEDHTAGAGDPPKLASCGIKWDRPSNQFVFVGNPDHVQPAARLFFDEVLAESMDWLKPFIVP